MHLTRKSSRFSVAILTATLAIGVGAVPSAVAATTTKASSDDLGTSQQDMKAVWTEYGVPADTQAALLQKLDAGQGIDSMTGARPVSSETTINGDKQTTVARFNDGSITVATIEPNGSSLTRSVDSCAVDAPTYANDCRVHGWFGTVELTFVSSYRKMDLQASVYNWGQAAFTCGPLMTCSDPKFELVRQYQSGSLAAQINLYTNWNTAVSNGRATLSLFAKDRGAWSN